MDNLVFKGTCKYFVGDIYIKIQLEDDKKNAVYKYTSSHKTKKDFIASICNPEHLNKHIDALKNKKELSFEFDSTPMTNTYHLSASYYSITLYRLDNETINNKEYHLNNGDAVKYSDIIFPFNDINTNNIISFIEQIKKIMEE
jgi:hypothetical protein